MMKIKRFNENEILKESAVVILNLENTSKYLFLLRREGYCLPGGKLDEGETHKEGAIRECFEETGIIPENLKYLGTGTAVNGRIVHVYSGQTTNPNVIISNEHSDWKWVESTDISKLKLAGNTGEFLDLM